MAFAWKRKGFLERKKKKNKLVRVCWSWVFGFCSFSLMCFLAVAGVSNKRTTVIYSNINAAQNIGIYHSHGMS